LLLKFVNFERKEATDFRLAVDLFRKAHILKEMIEDFVSERVKKGKKTPLRGTSKACFF